MSTAVMLVLLLAGTALQSLLPTSVLIGYAPVPVLASLVVYYALYRGGVLALAAALVAGLFQDSLSLMPPGYSSFGFAIAALVISRYRDIMVIQSPLTHLVVTAAVHGSVTLLLSLLLLNNGLIVWQPFWFFLRIPGALLLGAVTGPLIMALTQELEERLGLIQGNNDSYGAQRSFYGIG